MPAHITHSVFGNEILASTFADGTVCGYKLNKSAFEWALQGPDIMFFAMLGGDRYLPGFGSVMHSAYTDDLFLAMQEYAIKVKDSPDFSAVFSYICGFVCHYVLDKNCHPYVYCMQERIKEKHHELFSIHNKIESDIDSATAKHRLGQTARQFKIQPARLKDSSVYMPIARLYEYVLGRAFHIYITAEQFMACFKGSKRYYTLVIERFGIGGIARFYDRLVHKKGKSYGHLRTPFFDKAVMNDNHEVWHNLNAKEIDDTRSFDDIFDESKIEAADMIKRIASIMLSGAPTVITSGYSFDNGNPAH